MGKMLTTIWNDTTFVEPALQVIGLYQDANVAALLTGIEEWAKEASPAFAQLASLAGRAGTDFFAHAISEPVDGRQPALTESFHAAEDLWATRENFNPAGRNE